jgi:hypothetical protein
LRDMEYKKNGDSVTLGLSKRDGSKIWRKNRPTGTGETADGNSPSCFRRHNLHRCCKLRCIDDVFTYSLNLEDSAARVEVMRRSFHVGVKVVPSPGVNSRPVIKNGYRGNLAKLRRRSAVDGFRGGSAGVAYDGSLAYPRAPVAVTTCFHVELDTEDSRCQIGESSSLKREVDIRGAGGHGGMVDGRRERRRGAEERAQLSGSKLQSSLLTNHGQLL